jgi:hypothetical protein
MFVSVDTEQCHYQAVLNNVCYVGAGPECTTHMVQLQGPTSEKDQWYKT